MVVLLVTAGYDGSIRFWDASSGMCYRSLPHADKHVNALAITPDKAYIAAAGNPAIKLYEVNSRGVEPLVTYEGHTSNVTGIGFQKDGRWMYSCSEDGSVKIWDLRSKNSQRDYDCAAGVNAVVLHPNQGELISGDASGTIRVWDLTANRCCNELVPEGDTPISSVSIAPDASLFVAANFNGGCYFWTPLSSEEYVPKKRLQAHKAYITCCRLSPDTRYVATASSDRSVKLWNTRDYSLSMTLAGHSKWVWDAAFSADSSYIVTSSSDMLAKLWEVGSGEVVRTYSGHAKAVTAVALNDAPPVLSSGPPVVPGSNVVPSTPAAAAVTPTAGGAEPPPRPAA